jgi:hypothetical protein
MSKSPEQISQQSREMAYKEFYIGLTGSSEKIDNYAVKIKSWVEVTENNMSSAKFKEILLILGDDRRIGIAQNIVEYWFKKNNNNIDLKEILPCLKVLYHSSELLRFWLAKPENNFNYETLRDEVLPLLKGNNISSALSSWLGKSGNNFDYETLREEVLPLLKGNNISSAFRSWLGKSENNLDFETLRREILPLLKKDHEITWLIEFWLKKPENNLDFETLSKEILPLLKEDREIISLLERWLKKPENNSVENLKQILPFFEGGKRQDKIEDWINEDQYNIKINNEDEIKLNKIIKAINANLLGDKNNVVTIMSLARYDFMLPKDQYPALCEGIYPDSEIDQNTLFNTFIRYEVNGLSDAISDYATKILGSKFARAINADKSISEEVKNEIDFSTIKETLYKQAEEILLNSVPMSERMAFAKAFSDAWHSPLQQQKSLKVKDYNGESWPSLLGPKELEVPESVVKQAGYRLVARTTADELKEEGRKLNHCVGGYTPDCNIGRSHIISVVNPQVDPISTIEYEADPAQKKLICIQHYGKSNDDPSAESKSIQKWFEEIKLKELNIDYKGLEEKRADRVAKAKTFKQKIILELGFNPFDDNKLKEVFATCSDMADTTTKGVAAKLATGTTGARQAIAPAENFRDYFKVLLQLKEITLDTPIGGKTTFSLEEKKEAGKKKEKVEIERDDILKNIQTSTDIIFGEGKVTVSILNPEIKHGQVLLTPIDGVQIKDQIDKNSKLKANFDNFEEKGAFKSKFSPLPIKELLKSIANADKKSELKRD